MSNKLIPLVVVMFVIVAFVVMSIDKNDKSSDGFSQMIPRLGESGPVPSVDVWVSESKKFEANEFVTVAMLEIHGREDGICNRWLCFSCRPWKSSSWCHSSSTGLVVVLRWY